MTTRRRPGYSSEEIDSLRERLEQRLISEWDVAVAAAPVISTHRSQGLQRVVRLVAASLLAAALVAGLLAIRDERSASEVTEPGGTTQSTPAFLDFASGAVFEHQPLDGPATKILFDLTQRLGTPTADTGWITPANPEFKEFRSICVVGPDRVVSWNGLSVHLERPYDGQNPVEMISSEVIMGWTVTSNDVLLPATGNQEARRVLLRSNDGVGVGSTRSEALKVAGAEEVGSMIVIDQQKVVIQMAEAGGIIVRLNAVAKSCSSSEPPDGSAG
jgi:hypothetical protein